MKLHFSILTATVVALLCAMSPHVSADTLFESGTLGPTGIPFSDLGNAVPGTNIKDVTFNGVRFQITQAVSTTQIGGHFVAQSGGTFFGAIIELEDENDFPNSGDLTSPDVLGTTLLTFPVPSDEVFGDLTLLLDSGWYALVFGSGIFESTTNGGAVRNGTDIGNPPYINWQPGLGWFNLEGSPVSFDNHRFVVKGYVIPEPNSLGLLMTSSLCFLLRRPLHKAPLGGQAS